MIASDPRLPQPPGDAYAQQLSRRLGELFRDLTHRVELLARGSLAGTRNAATAAPTTGTWAQGDFVRHSAPVEAGVAGSKYVVLGWVCVAGGTPGTWLATRVLTGN